MLNSKPNEVIKSVSKSNIQASSFHGGFAGYTLKVGINHVVKSTIDGKAAYFIERRVAGHLESSKTVTSIKELKAAL
jgi:hypothetical protein